MTDQPDVMRTLGSTVRAIRARFDRALQTMGLRLGQYQVLRALWECDGMTPREIAAELGVEMPTVTRTVQRMLRDGLVRREANPGDARSVRIYLTARSAELRERVTHLKDAQTAVALQGLRPQQLQVLVELLERIEANARD